MNKLCSYLLACVAAIALIGCNQLQLQPTAQVAAPQYQRSGETDLVAMSYAIADKLESNLKAPISPEDTIIVASFVDVNDLNVSTRFGRIVAEQVGSRLAQKGYKIKEIKLRQKSVFVEEGKGEFLLSRDLKEISANHSASAVVVGTYTSSLDRIYVSTRIVNPSDSVVLSSSDCSMLASSMLQSSLLK